MLTTKKLLLLSLITGFSVMVIELTAARIVAPILGNSIYTWTSIIGIVLLGASGGNYVGGKIIDKQNKLSIISTFFLLSSSFVLYIPIIAELNSRIIFQIPTLWVAVLTLSSMLFFVPSFFLGALYPMIVKQFIEDVASIGRDSGILSASWSVGSILGTFLTGFVFIGYTGSSGTLLAISIVLFLCSLWLASGTNSKFIVAFLYITLAAIYFNIEKNISSDQSVIFHKESNYYDIKVLDKDLPSLGKVRVLSLDGGAHNIESLSGKKFDSYTNIYPLFSVLKKNINDIAMIGGGSLELSNNFKEYYPQASVTTAEIDPEVTNVAEKYFRDSEYIIKNTVSKDGRVFLAQSDKKYDIIFSDAYNSFISVPWHMTTQEFFQLTKARLNAEGMVAINLISSRVGDNAAFYKSLLATFSGVFDNYYVFAYGNDDTAITQNIVLVGMNSNTRQTNTELRSALLDVPYGDKLASHLVETGGNNADDNHTELIFTDNFAPTDRLMMSTVSEYFQSYMRFMNTKI